MRVFVTGGTGFVGAGVVRQLLDSGHEVLALSRSERSASILRAAGAEPHQGSLEDLDALRTGAAQCDGVIHTAFNNTSLRQFRRSSRIERAALQAMGSVLAGSSRPLVAAGGLAPVVQRTELLTEADVASPRRGLTGRNVERTIMQLADAGVCASVVRLPCVHGDGDHFTLPRFIDLARRTGRSAFVGDGTNRIPAVHHVDAASVFCRALEHAEPGGRWHAVAEPGVHFGDIAQVIGRRLGVPVVALSGPTAWRHFGALTAYASSDRPASSVLTRERLDWTPTGPGLLADLDRPAYFRSANGVRTD